MRYTYSKNYNTSYSYVDRTGRLGLVEFLNMNQDMITEFYGSVGSDNLILREKNNAAWIYTRIRIETVGSLPFWNQKTKAVTFVCAKSAIRMELETDLYDENDNLLVVAKTEMYAIDFGTRKLRRIDTLEFPKDLEVMETNMPEGFSRLNTEFEVADMAYMQKVYAIDTDFTDHTNNVRYVKFIMNTFDSKFFVEKTIKGFEIQFVRESKDGDTLSIFAKNTGENEYSYLIQKADEAVVKAKLWAC